MAFSLSKLFKGKPGSENPEVAPASPIPMAPAPVVPTAPAAPAVSVPPSVRTVMPNSVQPVSLRSVQPGGARPAPMPLPVTAPPAPAPLTAPPGRLSPAMPAARGKIAFGGAPVASPEEAAPAPTPAPLPVAPAPEVPDVTVSLEVGDFLDRLPPSYVQTGMVDRQRRVDFRASELYSDLAKGRASVPASVIYARCPELFNRPVTDEEDVEVSLPLAKLVEQMSQAFQARPDQVAEENVGEIETPFLQVAMEDSARLPKAAGTTAGALRPTNNSLPVGPSPLNEPPYRPHRTGQISTISAPKVAPEPPPMLPAAPSAQTASPINAGKRPPSTVRASVAGGKIRLSGPTVPNRMSPVNAPAPLPPVPGEAPAPELPPSASQRILPPLQVPGAAGNASPSHQVTKKTARIQIPPISLRGTGGPGTAPKPASMPAPPSAVPVQPSPVPVRPAPNAAPSAPPITFRSSPPPASVKPMPHSFAPPPARPLVPPPAFPAVPAPAFTAAPTPAPAPATVTDDRKISLSLSAVLRGLPMSSLTVEPSQVPDDVRVTLPFAPVEPQLALGRVAVPVPTFSGALPESHREVLASNHGLTEIPLPLQEVFQNLPPAALSIRADQVTEEVGNLYPTPFAQKAEEDAQRFSPSAEVATPKEEEPTTPEVPASSATNHSLPVEPVVEDEAPAPPAAEPASEEPDSAFANLFAEEPSTPHRDIPLDLPDEKPATSAPVVEAKAPTEEKPLPPLVVEDKSPSMEEKPADAKVDFLATPAVEPALKEEAPQEPSQAVEEKLAVSLPEPIRANPVALTTSAPDKHEEPKATLPPPPATQRTEEPTVAAPVDALAAEEVSSLEPARTSLAALPSPKAAVAGDGALQTLFMTEDELDAKAVVRLVNGLPGVEGCAVMFEDGLQLAGNFPAEADREGFSAMAPPFFKRVRNFTGEVNLGELQACTLYTAAGLVSFFMHDNICVSVRHSGRGFLPGVREKLETVTRELARMYAAEQPAAR